MQRVQVPNIIFKDSLVPKTIKGMVLGARGPKDWVPGPSGMVVSGIEKMAYGIW